MLRAFGFFAHKRKTYLWGWLLACTELLTAYLTPLLYQQLILIMTDGRSSSAVHFFVLLMSALVVSLPLTVVGTYMKRTSTVWAKGELRKWLFSHIQTLPLAKFYQHSQGDYLTRIVGDADRAISVFNAYSITGLFKFVLYTALPMGIMLAYNWKIALVALLFGVISVLLSVVFNPRVRTLEHSARKEAAESTSLLMEAFRNTPIVRMFLLRPLLEARYVAICKHIAKRRIGYRSLNGISEGLIYIFSFCAQPISFIVGILLMLHGEISLANTVFLASIAAIMAEGMKGFSAFAQFIQPAIVACKRVFDIMDIPAEVNGESVPGTAFDPATPAISVQDLHFSYGGAKTLDGLTFDVWPGEKVALIGSSGGGKTTLMKLLQALYLPQRGSIAYFGRDAKDMSLDDIRVLMAYVPQTPALFVGNVGENIAFGKPGIAREKVAANARAARADSFIEAMHDGYDAVISD